MDSGVGQQQLDLSRLTDTDKKELQQFIAMEGQKARIQQAVHNLTDICWKKCVTTSIKSSQLEKAEDTCARNCVDRFLDANLEVIKNLERMRGGA